MTLTVENLEVILAIGMRITGFMLVAPFYGLGNIPQRVKVLLTFAVTIITYCVLPKEPLEYSGVIGYAALILSEAIAGLILGLFATLAMYILSFAGQLIDTEVGFSMVTTMDPSNSMQVTITSNVLTYAVTLLMVVSNLHLYILRAVIDSFVLIPVGKVTLSPYLYEGYLDFILNYMILAFRIVLPIFAALLIVNAVLGILAKASPQLNMFVIGFQLKIFVGLATLTIMLWFLPSISEMIFDEMITMIKTAAAYMMPQ